LPAELTEMPEGRCKEAKKKTLLDVCLVTDELLFFCH